MNPSDQTNDYYDPKTPPFSFEEDGKATEPVWTYRGYKLHASEFTTAMVHFFRAEVQRANVWRSRLDTTTNWAVITTGAALSIAFSQSGLNHVVILVNILLVTTFLIIEARRYRYYELWSYRVRLMETDFFAAMLVPPFQPSPEWSEALAESLLHPQFPISNWEALGRRMRRNYLYIYGVIGCAWLANLWLLPDTARNFEMVAERAGIGAFDGRLVLFVVAVFYVSLIIVGLLTIRMQSAAGEVLPRFGSNLEHNLPINDLSGAGSTEKHAWYRPAFRRKQLLTLIVTDRPQQVSERILKDMRRGVTALSGVGMFTGKAHQVLLCALTVTEVPHLKSLVKAEDADAFIIVSPAQEIYGKGFNPLEEK